MKIRAAACILLGLATTGFAQMPVEQKITDFQQLVALYDKNYGPYEWKVTGQKFDMLEIGAWMDRIRATKTDLDYMEVLVEYVASLNDAHDVLTFPSDFRASLGFTTDIYEGKVLIDSINRTRLPLRSYPFEVGDEVVSVDGVAADQLVTSFMKYETAANERSTRRLASSLIPTRVGSLMPHAHEIGDSAMVVVKRADGSVQSYTIPWLKTGTPITAIGPVPSPKSTPKAVKRDAEDDGVEPSVDLDSPVLRKLRNATLSKERRSVLSFGARAPIFRAPDGFVQRLGTKTADVFYSGTYKAGGYTIGFIRIPSFSPSSTATAIAQFESEIIYMQANTDGLIIDDMRNPGGSVCYGEALMAYLQPKEWRTLGFEIRATQTWVYDLSSEYEYYKSFGIPESDPFMKGIFYILRDVKQAYSENRGRTGPLALCDVVLNLQPATDLNGKSIAYTKPVMMLVDEMSASGGDAFPAIFQDNQRGPVFGMRTMGAGGTVVDYKGTNYSEADTRVTESIMIRKNDVVTSDYPAAPYVENIGVRPDIVVDYMTRDNLINRGQTFINAFTAAMVDHINKSKQ